MTISSPDLLRMPTEWEPHRATWIAWPHHEPDWPGKFDAIPWVYAEIVRVLAGYEPVEILCQSEEARASVQASLAAHDVNAGHVRLHTVPTDRVWLRDSAPTGMLRADGRVVLLDWGFNAWAKYDNWQHDDVVGEALPGDAAAGAVRALELARKQGDRDRAWDADWRRVDVRRDDGAVDVAPLGHEAHGVVPRQDEQDHLRAGVGVATDGGRGAGRRGLLVTGEVEQEHPGSQAAARGHR